MKSANYIEKIAEKIRMNFETEELPDRGLDELFAAYAVLTLSKGEYVTDEDVHNAWASWATKYDRDNESLVPYSELDPKTQRKDSKFSYAIKMVSKEL